MKSYHYVCTCSGVYLEDAFQVPKQLMGETFFAAVVLKVSPITCSLPYDDLLCFY